MTGERSRISENLSLTPALSRWERENGRQFPANRTSLTVSKR